MGQENERERTEMISVFFYLRQKFKLTKTTYYMQYPMHTFINKGCSNLWSTYVIQHVIFEPALTSARTLNTPLAPHTDNRFQDTLIFATSPLLPNFPFPPFLPPPPSLSPIPHSPLSAYSFPCWSRCRCI